MSDPYKTLKVSKKASKEEIKRQYRKLARENHPDLNPGHEEYFKEVASAYAILSDDQRLAQYKRGQLDIETLNLEQFDALDLFEALFSKPVTIKVAVTDQMLADQAKLKVIHNAQDVIFKLPQGVQRGDSLKIKNGLLVKLV